MTAVRSNLPKLARVPLDIGGQFLFKSFENTNINKHLINIGLVNLLANISMI